MLKTFSCQHVSPNRWPKKTELFEFFLVKLRNLFIVTTPLTIASNEEGENIETAYQINKCIKRRIVRKRNRQARGKKNRKQAKWQNKSDQTNKY